jgi:murein DD-endopeptidase MepM/ murein hydrolase activator NlpD
MTDPRIIGRDRREDHRPWSPTPIRATSIATSADPPNVSIQQALAAMARLLEGLEETLWNDSREQPNSSADLVIFSSGVERAQRGMLNEQVRLHQQAQSLAMLSLRLGHTVRELSATYGLKPPPRALAVTEHGDGWQSRMESAISSGGVSLGRVALSAAIGAASLGVPAKVAALPGSESPSAERSFDVVVGPGDTLVKLSERYYGTAQRAMEIARMNGISNPNVVAAGTTLQMPGASAGGTASAPTVNQSSPSTSQPSQVVVQPGDTLARISARVYGNESYFMEIARANGIADPNRIVAGATLKVPPLSGNTNFRLTGATATGGGTTSTASPSPPTTAPAASVPPSSIRFVWPVYGVRVQGGEYGVSRPDRPNGFHTGLDLAATTGTPVIAAAAGRVTHVGPEGTYGNTVVIDHGNGYVTRYAHLSAWQTWVGAQVAQGQRIGSVGATGYATGPHLHFEVISNGRFVNPTSVLP